MARELEPHQLVERSIVKKYKKELWNPFIRAIKQYELIQAGDRIAVCISGGKDSMLMAKLMQQLQKHSEVPFELEFLVMDPGYNPVNRERIESNAKLLQVPLKVFETDIFDVANSVTESPCYLCARMRRGHLYKNAQDLGCNKIALGHHFSDVIETTIMGMFYSGQLQGMMPKLHSTNFPGMELIRPMYCIHEDHIIAWARYNGLEFIQCACRFTEKSAEHEDMSKRRVVKRLIRELKKENPLIEKHIFNSIHAVSLDTMVGYKTDGVEHSFLERYDRNRQKSE
ncbi:MAG: tRNA 2-thiocytidine biosynthesis protein TtcA [Lachnospiraceae bacterium]|nr:tRNA 2-thiocytidine biosynthesis protein TtcA [Lachnospiraceae bacterium]